MADQSTRVLLVEDNPADTRLIEEMLQETPGFDCELIWAKKLATGLAKLSKKDIDVVLLDLGLPDSQGLATLTATIAQAPGMPIIVLTGLEDEHIGLEAIKAGAQEYLTKGTISPLLLSRAIRYATKRKAAEVALRGSEARYRSLAEAAQAAIFVIDREDRIVFVNAYAARLLGREPQELIGKPRSEMFSLEESEDQLLYLKRVFDSGEPHEAESEVMFGERKFWLSTQLVPLRDENNEIWGVMGVSRDITARKQAEYALRESEQRYSDVVNNLDDILFQTDNEGHWLFLNPAWIKVMGYTVEESLGEVFLDYVYPEDRERNIKLFKPLVEGKKDFCRHEIRYQTKDNQIRWFDIFGRLSHDKDGNITGTVGTLTDITERKAAEKALYRVNRALKMLSECNEAVVRATGESNLLEEACQLIVEVGGYRLAWVGYAEQDPKKSVRPAAQSGFEDGYLETLDITWSDKERGRGPTGTAIRTGKLVLARNILTEPDFAPWRAEATRRGYASSIALPLITEGQTFGALNVYAVEPDAFDGEEVKLLGELADDLAFGIAALRTRAERERAEAALQESEEKYRRIFENSPIGIIHYDEHGVITACNDNMSEILGATKEKLIDFNMVASLKDDRMRAALMASLSGKSGYFEGDYLSVTGGKHATVKVVFSPVLSEEGSVLGGVCIAEDITERKRAENALRESEERFRLLFENSQDGIVIVNRKGELLIANEAAANNLDYTRDEFLKLNIADIEAVESKEDFEEHFSEMLKGKRLRFETRHRRKDGSLMDVDVQLNVINLKGKNFSFSIWRDITERKAAEERIDHLNFVLRAVRNVDQLIIREKDRGRLVKGTCEELVKTRGYTSAWIALLDEQRKLVTSAQSGLGRKFAPLRKRLKRGEMIECGREALEQPEVVAIADPAVKCGDCPLLGKEPENRTLTVRLEHSGRVYGLMSVSLPQGLAADREEQELFCEVADDIAFALHGLEVAERHELAEAALHESEERYRMLVEQSVDAIYLLDPQTGRVLEANSAFCRFLGYTAEEVKTLFLYDFVAHENADIDANVQGILKSQGITIGDRIWRRKDGTELDVNVIANTIHQEGRETIFIVARDITARKATEAALRESEERFRSLVETATDAIVNINDQGRITLWNRAATRLFGFTRKEALGADFHTLTVPKRYRKKAKVGLAVFRKGGKGKVIGRTIELAGVRKDGSEFPIELSVSRLWRGDEWHATGIIRDITERKAAEAALRESEEKYRGIFGDSVAAVYVFDAEKKFVDSNQAGLDLLGYSREELLDMSIPDVDADPEAVQPAHGELFAGGKLVNYEHQLKRKSGRIITVLNNSRPLIDGQGNFVGIQSTLVDITDRRQAEAALRESEARFRGAFENAAVGVSLVDTEGRFVRANQALCDLLGYAEAELRAMTFFEITHPDDIRTGVYEKKRMLSGEAEHAKFEKRYIHKQGREIWALVSPSLVRDPDDKPLYFVTQIQDITERKRAEAALKEYSAHLEEMVAERTHELVAAQEELVRKEKFALLGQLAGSVSHELRNPLGVISNAIYYLQTISRDADVKTREYLAIIADEVRQSEAIITGLLDFGRFQTPQRAPAVVAQLVTQTLAKEPPPPEVEVTTELPSDLPEVAVDAQQIRQILVNLISNACQAMPGGGQLTVAARPRDEQVLLTVTDTGSGIAPENLEQVFEPLFTTRARSIGLGLALSRQLAEAGDGSLTVASEPGKGTTFTLTLPLSEGD